MFYVYEMSLHGWSFDINC